MPIAAAGVGTGDLALRLTGPNTDLTQRFQLGVASGSPRRLPALGDAAAERRDREHFRRCFRRLHPGDRLDCRVGLALRRDRRPGGAAGAAALPLWLLGADGKRRHAAPLRQPLASVERLDIDPDLDGRIKLAIERELSRQSASGAFGMWTADSGDDDPWLDAFVADFLTRARELNFVVPQQAFDQALDRLRNEVVNAPEPSKDNAAPLAYALYVLARNGRPVIGDLRYLSDAKLEAFATPLGKAQLAAALAMLGDRARAGKVFAAALAALESERDEDVSRPDYGSRLRDAAAVLALVAEANLGGDSEADGLKRAGAVLEQARAARSFTSTQENNWMALAAEALGEHMGASQFTVDGEPVKGALYRRFSDTRLAGGPSASSTPGRMRRNS